jgi:alkaline phosphatase
MDGCQVIVLQLVNFENNLKERYTGVRADGVDVIMGGGRQHFFLHQDDPSTRAFLISKLPRTFQLSQAQAPRND